MKRLITIASISLLFQLTYAQNYSNAPEAPVIAFYEHLLSGGNPPHPNLFIDTERTERDVSTMTNYSEEGSAIWNYIRSNRDAFMIEGLNEENLREKLHFAYYIIPPRNGDLFTEGSLSVVVFHPIKDYGAIKQIAFHVRKVTENYNTSYKIEFGITKINGTFMLDFLDFNNHKKPFLEVLGRGNLIHDR